MQDHIARAMALKGSIRAIACVTTQLTNQICTMQETSPIATITLGRALAGTALLGSTLKQGQHIAVKFEGSGPLQKVIAEADWNGTLRGTVAQPQVDATSVPDALGRAGFLTVRKDLGLREPYSGTIPLYTSEIAEDIAYYLTDSEQVPSAVGITVRLDDSGMVSAAGGFLIQSLPPSDPAMVEQLLNSINKLPPLHELLTSGTTPTELLERLLSGIDHHLLEQTPLSFGCSCSQTKAEQAVCSLGVTELKTIIAEEETTTITCEFCKQRYTFGKEALEEIISHTQA